MKGGFMFQNWVIPYLQKKDNDLKKSENQKYLDEIQRANFDFLEEESSTRRKHLDNAKLLT
jgi:hypothetical protein